MHLSRLIGALALAHSATATAPWSLFKRTDDSSNVKPPPEDGDYTVNHDYDKCDHVPEKCKFKIVTSWSTE